MIRKDIKNKFLSLLEQQRDIPDTVRPLLEHAETFSALEQQVAQAKIASAEEFTKLKAGFFRLPYIDLTGQKINPTTLHIVPKDFAENYLAIAFSRDNTVLSVGIVEPTELKAREAIEFLARGKDVKVQFVAISYASFNDALKQYTALKSEVAEYLGDAKARFKEPEVGTQSIVDDTVTSAPIAKMVSVILKHAVEEQASDIHIEPVMNQTRVRYRVDGLLKTSLVLPRYVHAAIVSRIKVMARLKIDETRVPQDGRIRLEIGGRNIDFRISTLPLYRNEKVVMRILDSSQDTLSLKDLGFEGHNLEVMEKNIKKPNGMFLVTGPTGSGKTTTLYAVLSILNKEEVNIVTLEDPVEYFRKGINQSQINPDVGLTFASGLRSILRQDPDIVMVGEIRDKETGDLAIHAALTGHFMLSTLHTNDAFGALPRLIDLGVESFLLASTLNIVIAQRLVRTICLDCKEITTVPEKFIEEIRQELSTLPKTLLSAVDLKKPLVFYKGRGCQRCGDTGYKGRIAIVEVLAMNERLKEIVTSKSGWENVKKIFTEQGMTTLKQDGILKALNGVTTVEEVLRVTKE